MLEYFLLGFGGAMSVEVLKLYEMMGNVEARKFKKVVASKLYWFMTILMASASGFIAWGINYGVSSTTVWQVILAGIGARTLLVKPIEIKVAHKNAELGEHDKVSLKDIYG